MNRVMMYLMSHHAVKLADSILAGSCMNSVDSPLVALLPVFLFILSLFRFILTYFQRDGPREVPPRSEGQRVPRPEDVQGPGVRPCLRVPGPAAFPELVQQWTGAPNPASPRRPPV